MFSFRSKQPGLHLVSYKNSPIVFSSSALCSSDIFTIKNKYYIRLQFNDPATIQFLASLDFSCESQFPDFKSSLTNHSILVKLPFRYKRFQIHYSGTASSENLSLNSLVSVTVSVCGIVDSSFCSFKLTSLSL